jgi:Tfp pilus assembly protein PilO
MENSMQKKSFDTKGLIAVFIFLLALAAGIFYVNPLWTDVTSLAMGRDDQVVQRDQLNKKLNDLQALQQSLNLQTEVSRQTNLDAIPLGFEEDILINDINALADESKMTINGINFGTPEDVNYGEVGKIGVNVNMSGEDGNLLTFLRKVESDSRKIIVKSISVQNVVSEDAKIKMVNFNLNLETYFQGMNKQ